MSDEGEESDNGAARKGTESPSLPRSPGAPGGSPPPSPGPLDLFSSTSPLLCDPESYLTSPDAVHRRSPSLGDAQPATPPKFHRRSRDPESYSRARRQDARLATGEGARDVVDPDPGWRSGDRDVDPGPGWRRGDRDADSGRFQHRRFKRTQDPTDYGNHYSIQPELSPETRQHQHT